MSMIRFASFAGWLAYLNLWISLFGGYCGVFYLISLVVAPMSVGPQLIRAIVLWGMVEQSRILLEEDLKDTGHRKARQLSRISERGESPESSSKEIAQNNAVKDKSSYREKAEKVKMQMRKLVNITRWGLLVIPTGLLVLASAVSSDSDQLMSTDFDTCLPGPKYVVYVSPAIGVIVAFFALATTIFVRNCDDELGIRKEITRNVILLAVTYILITTIRLIGYYEWQPLMQTTQQIMLSFSMVILPCFHKGKTFIPWIQDRKRAIPSYGRPLPVVESKRLSINKFRRVSQKEIDTDKQRKREMTLSLDAGLCILLSSGDGMKAFTEHCAREFSIENMLFWCSVNEFRKDFALNHAPSCDDDQENIDDSDLKAQAQFIYDTYITPISELQINIPSSISQDIAAKMSSKEIKADMFDKAQKEIFSVMSRDSYPRFLSSSYHDKYVQSQQKRKSVRRFSVI